MITHVKINPVLRAEGDTLWLGNVRLMEATEAVRDLGCASEIVAAMARAINETYNGPRLLAAAIVGGEVVEKDYSAQAETPSGAKDEAHSPDAASTQA